MKKFAKISALALALATVGNLAACGSSGGGVTLKFFSWGNDTEVALTRELVDEFNRLHEGEITVNFTPIATGDYESKITNALRGRSVPDVIVAGDGEIKQWIDLGGIAKLDEYAAASSEIDLGGMWQDGVNRYRYDAEARRGGTGDLYGIMRDYSPSVLFYNIDAMKAVGIECISLDDAACEEKYGVASGYFTYDGQEYFNNKIAMTWDEFLALGQKLTANPDAPVRNDNAITKYGMYVIYWFCFGWSVGGNCLEWTGDGYEFTLFDETKNYIVDEGKEITVNGNAYSAGEIVTYADKGALTDAQKGDCTELPSQMEAMQYFVDLSVEYGVSPKPDVSASNSEYGLFSSAQCAMLIDTRYAVGIFRKTIPAPGERGGFDWDVAPLPQYKGGIAAGHSGSLAYCIPEKSTKKDAAWKFIEFMAGSYGESKFAEAGFTIPNTEALSKTDTFLQPGQRPQNSQIFVDAAYYQRTGDWGYLPSKAWINEWSADLNNKVLLGTMSLSELKAKHSEKTQSIIDAYYAK